MFTLYAEKTRLTVRDKEPVTSGSVNVYPVRFEFSADWDGLEKTAIFQTGCREKAVVLTGGACTVPAEVLAEPGYYLMAGVCGKQGESTVLPTVWANLGMILEGAVMGEAPEPGPLPEDWQEALASKGDNLAYTDAGELGLYSGDKLLSSVPVGDGEFNMGQQPKVMPVFNRQMAEDWVFNMKNADGTRSPHFSLEKTKEVQGQYGIDCDEMEFWTVMNMLYSAFGDVLKENNVSNMKLYTSLAKAWIEDQDAVHNKAAAYYTYVVQH